MSLVIDETRPRARPKMILLDRINANLKDMSNAEDRVGWKNAIKTVDPESM